MYEITKDNYKDIDFNGVIISVPREHLTNELTQDFCLHFECAYYTDGKHGYKECGHMPSRSSFFSIWYGDEDMPNGFGFNSTSKLPWDEKYLHFNNVRYYKFKDMEEFCTWYLQNKNYEVWSYSSNNDLKGKIHNIEATSSINQNNEWIHEKCGTNTPPTSVPKHPSKGNKKKSLSETEELKDIYTEDEIREKVNPGWNTRKNKYSDILEYIEMRLDLMQASNNLSEGSNYQEQQKYQYIIEQNQKKIDKWLNEEVQ